MNGWFLALIILHAISLGTHSAKHGKPREDSYNFWSSLFGSLIGVFLIYMAIKTGF